MQFLLDERILVAGFGFGPATSGWEHVLSDNTTKRHFPSIPAYDLDYPSYLALNRCDWHVAPGDAVLLVYDMQKWYVDRYQDPSALIANIKALRRAAVGAGVPVVFACAEPVRHLAERGIAADLWGAGIGAAADGRPDDAEMHPELAPGDGDFIVRKRKYSAFFETDFEKLLRRINRSQIILCGNYANHGCTVTAVDAYMRNFKVFFVADALGAFDAASHDLALRYVADLCGQIALTETVIAEISA